ncbi:hypothetical protein GCM10009795_015680 [Nocardioides hankookensis]|uniref:Uncharacterized protein n=1 Tax=Nocardioides hankookensis TaxID=443157 RepID=A0ABW1LKI5_9ACTN
MFAIGAVEILIMLVVGAATAALVLYAVIRLAVRDGMSDAERRAADKQAADAMRQSLQQSRASDV